MVCELAGSLNLGRRLDKRLPQVKVGFERLPGVLGVPLHAQAEGLALDLDALGHAVGCLGDQARMLAQTIDAAMLVWMSLCPPSARSSSEPGTTSTGCTGSLSTWV